MTRPDLEARLTRLLAAHHRLVLARLDATVCASADINSFSPEDCAKADRLVEALEDTFLAERASFLSAVLPDEALGEARCPGCLQRCDSCADLSDVEVGDGQ